tara:strand:- start:150 stop:1133 length:984 start_codon:yes stop_codon:yes gene_type:complete
MDEQIFLINLPITITFFYFTYTIIDSYFYNKYVIKNIKNNNEEIYYDLDAMQSMLTKLKPLQCSKTLLNFNSYDNDNVNELENKTISESSDESNLEENNITDTSSINTDDESIFDEQINDDNEPKTEYEIVEAKSKEYNTFISTNYEEEFKKINNPFYKNLNIKIEVLFDKIKDNDLTLIKEIIDLINKNNYVLEKENDEYYKLIIDGNNFKLIFNNLFIIFNKYYLETSNINIVFNKEQLNFYKKYIYNEIIQDDNKPNYKYLNFNIVNISDLYGYINNEKKILNYNDINFKNVEDLRTYYNIEIMNLENNKDNTNLFENIMKKFY